MNIIVWILFGTLAGWVTRTLMKHETQMGLMANIIVGIAGASIGGFLMTTYGAGDMTGLTRYGILMAILGAGSLLFLVNTFQRVLNELNRRKGQSYPVPSSGAESLTFT